MKSIKVNGKLLPIRNFKLDLMNETPQILIITSNCSNKYELIKNIINSLGLKRGIITTKDKKKYLYDESQFCDNFDNNFIDNLLERQYQIIKKDGVDKAKCYFIIDCHFEEMKKMNGNFQSLIFRARYDRITNIIILEDPLKIYPDVRCNIDYIFVNTDNELDLKKIYYQYGNMISDFDTFKDISNQVIKNDNFMVINQRGYGESLDRIFYYKN